MQLTLQLNNRARDYVYELSVCYLISRAIHVVIDMRIAEHLSLSGTTLAELMRAFPEYDEEAVHQLLDYLASYGIFKIGLEKKIFPTDLSLGLPRLASTLTCDEAKWQASYDQFNDIQFLPELTARLSGNTVTLESDDPQNILKELAQGYLLSRIIRVATTSGLFDQLLSVPALSVEALRRTYFTSTPSDVFVRILKVLDRYQLLAFDEQTQQVRRTDFSAYLTDQHPQTMKPAMRMIDQKWWNAAAMLPTSLRIGTKPAFEAANDQTFYQAYLQPGADIFSQGMAAISLLEDVDVAEILRSSLKDCQTIIDIGGGEAGLLGSLYRIFGSAKKYILFEKTPEDGDIDAACRRLRSAIAKRFGDDFQPEIVFGDFYKTAGENSLPRETNAAYLIKCVLHNMPSEREVKKVLRHVKKAMGENSHLFLVERMVRNTAGVDRNRSSNFLMRLLFKAGSKDPPFYQRCAHEVGFETARGVLDAGSYQVISAWPTSLQQTFGVSVLAQQSAGSAITTHADADAAASSYLNCQP